MRIDFSRTLADLRGGQIMNDGTPCTLGLVCFQALNGAAGALSAEDKRRRYRIMQLIADDGMHDLADNDRDECKKAIAETFGPLVMGQAHALLDGGAEAKG